MRRCLNFASLWRATRIDILNLFAYRATDPAALRRAADPVGPDNDAILRAVVEIMTHRENAHTKVICGWGVHGALHERATHVRAMIESMGVPLYYLRMGKSGQPWHPLYLPNASEPVEWRH